MTRDDPSSLNRHSPPLKRFPSETLQREVADALNKTIQAWFPRCLDSAHGGFLCDFDSGWGENGPHDKMLEFQARTTRAAAQAALLDGSNARCRAAAEHGFAFLSGAMWDRECGGWYRIVDRRGRVLDHGIKHGHGTAYAISACAAHFRLTGDPRALELAQAGFAWLEAHYRDCAFEGYQGPCRREGTPILQSDRHPAPGTEQDHLGYPLGVKDANTHFDLAEALADLYRIWPDGRVRLRLETLLELFRTRFIREDGRVQLWFRRDWMPLDSPVNTGIQLQAIRQMDDAEAALGRHGDSELRRCGGRLLEYALSYWDDRAGGFIAPAANLQGRPKEWWPQAEALGALLRAFRATGQARFLELFERQWQYIRSQLIDSDHGGWFHFGMDYAGRPTNKGQIWKDCSHEVRALRDCLEMLRSSPPG
jgi:mannobiose 2-epimerase